MARQSAAEPFRSRLELTPASWRRIAQIPTLYHRGRRQVFYATGIPEQMNYDTPTNKAWMSTVDYSTNAALVDLNTYFSTYSAAGGYLWRNNGEMIRCMKSPRFNNGTSGTGKYTTHLDYGVVLDGILGRRANMTCTCCGHPCDNANNTVAPNFDISNTDVKSAFLGYWQYVINRYAAFVDIWSCTTRRRTVLTSRVRRPFHPR